MQANLSIGRSRGRYEGMLQIIRFNWPVYAAAVVICGAILIALVVLPILGRVRWVAWGVVAGASYWMVASMLASHWIYDRSELYRWTWIRDTLPAAPVRWVNIHVGLDEASSV